MRDIGLFLDVFDAGGFAPVARARRADPSTVSRAIAALESDLGVSLFDRTTRRLRPTQEGLGFEARIRPVMAHMRDAVSEVRDQAGPVSGLVRISASVGYGLSAVTPLLAAFRRDWPGIEIDLVLTDTRLDLLRENIDIALRHGRLRDSSYKAVKLHDVRYRLVASPDYLARKGRPTVLSDLSGHDLMSFTYAGFSESWTFRAQTGELQTVPISPIFRTTSAMALRRMAVDGAGIAILPEWSLAQAPLDTVLPEWDVTGGAFERAIWVMTPERTYRPKRVAAVLDYLRSALSP